MSAPDPAILESPVVSEANDLSEKARHCGNLAQMAGEVGSTRAQAEFDRLDNYFREKARALLDGLFQKAPS